MEKPERSVNPKDLFLLSLETHQGDIFQALLTVENILTENRADPNRNSLSLAQRLKYAAGPSGQTGDNIGAYYHFFGTALISYARGDSWVGKAAAYFDEVPSFVMEPIDPNETVAGLNGAEFGRQIRAL